MLGLLYYVEAREKNSQDKYTGDGLHWIRKAAEQGQIKAQGMLCFRYAMEWNNLPQNRHLDLDDRKWCINAANHGYTPSQHHLGFLFAYGYGGPKDEEKAYF